MDVQIAVRVPSEDLIRLDEAVARGAFPNRAKAVRIGLRRLLREAREQVIERAYRRGYGSSSMSVGSAKLACPLAPGCSRRTRRSGTIRRRRDGGRRLRRRLARNGVAASSRRHATVRNPLLTNVTVALITTRVRGLPTEVELGTAHGVAKGSVVNTDNVLTVEKSALSRDRGTLGPADLRGLDQALRLALALD